MYKNFLMFVLWRQATFGSGIFDRGGLFVCFNSLPSVQSNWDSQDLLNNLRNEWTDDIYNLPELYNLKEDLEHSMVDKSQDHQSKNPGGVVLYP